MKNTNSNKPIIDKTHTDDDFEIEPKPKNFAKDGRFYIFGDIDENFSRDIIVPFIEEAHKRKADKSINPIEIYINSYGGLVHEALDFVAHIEMAKLDLVQVHTYILSNAMSAATLIAIVGTKRIISKRTQFMIHYSRGFEYSHNPEMAKNNFEANLFQQKAIVGVYTQYTKVKEKDVEKKMLVDNYFISGQELIRLGFADAII